jgi:DNA-binding CsgD family transcriptional regulator
MLRGRRSECAVFDRLLDALRTGESAALVVRGEPGTGKTALLEYAVESASDLRVARAAGVESEMELAFAGLQQLCAPMLDRLECLPDPQRDALGTAFGLSAGAAPDRFLVGLAALNLLSEVAGDKPVLCVVDDAQWLDRASAQVLAFVARRLLAESVAVVFASREASPELDGFPELIVRGLSDADARGLLASVIPGALDESVRDRIVAETGGNPLALLELPRGLTPAQLAGGFGLPNALPISGRIEESFRRRLEPLPAGTRRLLLVAAAEPLGEPVLLWRAAESLGVGVEEAAPAEAAGLVEFGARVQFRHPLVRSAVYRAGSAEDRRTAHGALADATDPEVDPDRRAWHRAHATAAPDEDVAADLERSAGRAQARGGVAAAAAFLERATELTPEPARRAERSLAAAQTRHQAGAPDAALELLATTQAGPLDELQRARVDVLRAQVAFASSRGDDAPPLLLKAAMRLEPLDVTLARETYLEAFSAAIFAGRLAAGIGLLEVAEAARAAPPSRHSARPADLLLDGLAVLITEGDAAGAPVLKRALTAFRGENLSIEEELRWLWLICRAAMKLWDDESWYVLSTRAVGLARDAGTLTVLPHAITLNSGIYIFAGEFATAEALRDEAHEVSAAIGIPDVAYTRLILAGWRGQADTPRLIEASNRDAIARGEGRTIGAGDYAAAVLYNGLGRYADALAAAQQSSEHPEELVFSTWGSFELIEAATRTGRSDLAADALRQLSETTRAAGTDWALGVEAHSRALVSEGEVAENLYREAIERLARTRARAWLARAHLVYGEWLRRENRRLDARDQLRTAHEMLASMGAGAFADRAARELLATGETAPKRTIENNDQLTAQEAQIARLAGDGLTNPEIGTRLFISPRTVQYHLRKVFAKLDISSRNELHRALPAEPSGATGRYAANGASRRGTTRPAS